MKNRIKKQASAFFAPALFLLCLTSSTVMDKNIKQQDTSKKVESTTLEVRTHDIIEFKNISNESGQPIECEISFIEKSTSATRKHYQMKIGLVLQERIKEQDSCILISRQGFKPLKINLNITKGGDANQPTMHFLNIQLANSTSEQVSKITQKQEQVVKIAFEIKKLKRIK